MAFAVRKILSNQRLAGKTFEEYIFKEILIISFSFQYDSPFIMLVVISGTDRALIDTQFENRNAKIEE